MFLNNRHYNPETGTFLSVDPLVMMTGEPYIYGAANPVTYSDPTGLCPDPGCWEQLGPVMRELAGQEPPGYARQRERERNNSIADSVLANSGKKFANGNHRYTQAQVDWARNARCDNPSICGRQDIGMREVFGIATLVGGFIPWVGEGIDFGYCVSGDNISCLAMGAPIVGGKAVRAAGDLFRAADAGAGVARGGRQGGSLWSLSREGASATRRIGNTTYFKSASDGTWWVRDTAGHAGSTFKVYAETSRGLQWIADADAWGNYIVGKHKSDAGMFVPWK